MSFNLTRYFYNYKGEAGSQGNTHLFPTWDAAVEAAENCSTEYFLLADFEIADVLNNDFIDASRWHGDVLHCGYKFDSDKILQQLQVATFSWFFLNHEADVRSVSWRASSHLLIIRKACWLHLNRFFSEYTSNDVRVMDFAYRVLRSGGEVIYEPRLLSRQSVKKKCRSDDFNDFLFARKNLHIKAAYSVLVFKILSRLNPFSAYRAYTLARRVNLPERQFTPGSAVWQLVKQTKQKSIPNYSAIIPTLNRYEYLPGAIESLLNQTHPPTDIVVYDQSDLGSRNPALFEKYPNVKVIFADTKGQSSARNKALEHVQHEWCLLFDDDSVALPSMAEEHIKLLEYSDYLVSTGASLAPGQQFTDLPYTINFIHHADVLDSGNCFLNLRVLREVGFFDRAFDKGPGADNDLGTRIYLKGIEILFNPKAVRIHFKAKTGGLRTFGVWWRFKTTVTGAYPPPSQTYTVQKFYPRVTWSFLYLRFFLKASYRQNFFQLVLLWIFAPLKLWSSIKEAKKLKKLNEIV